LEVGSTYWARKRQELELLAAAAEIPTPSAATVEELVSAKRWLRARLQARFIESHPELTESNLAEIAPPLGEGTLRWSYRRFDERISARVQSIYPDLKARVAFAIFSGSGMAAISAALQALDAALPDGTPLGLPVDAYFETLRVAGRLRRLRATLNRETPAGAVHYLDSITTHDRSRFDARGLGAVAFDTTCYDAADARIAEVVERCAGARVPCILLRSHLKLDCLGLEYGALGSMVVVLPDRPEAAQVALARKLRSGALDRLALGGGNFAPSAVFPLAAEARALNQARNQAMAHNQARAGARLKESCAPTGVTVPHHGCFLILRPAVDTLWAGSRYLSRLIAALQQNRVMARAAPSFGYDLVAATLLRVPERRQSSIRLALPDFDEAELDRVVEIVAREAAGWLPTMLA
jgi:hypothetical protein